MDSMARPRFHRLSVAHQEAILDAARQEFTAHGYRRASLNRIIEVAGISKGSMYYYFDGKEDLYAEVIREQLQALFERTGHLPVPTATEPVAFWATVENHYLRLMRTLAESPEPAALLRAWLSDPDGPVSRSRQDDAERALLPWMTQALAVGQRIGAVRTDVPSDLLLAVVMAVGQAMDTWMITAKPDVDLERSVPLAMSLLRRALAP